MPFCSANLFTSANLFGICYTIAAVTQQGQEVLLPVDNKHTRWVGVPKEFFGNTT